MCWPRLLEWSGRVAESPLICGVHRYRLRANAPVRFHDLVEFFCGFCMSSRPAPAQFSFLHPRNATTCEPPCLSCLADWRKCVAGILRWGIGGLAALRRRWSSIPIMNANDLHSPAWSLAIIRLRCRAGVLALCFQGSLTTASQDFVAGLWHIQGAIT